MGGWPYPQQKGAWRCRLCSINYPNDRDMFRRCLACDEDCTYYSNVFVDKDWLDKAQDLIMHWEGGDHNTVPHEWTQETASEEGEPGASEGS